MMTSGAKHLQRLLAFALTLMLLMTTWTIPALALDDWDNLTIEVSWSGADGATQIATAVPVPDSPEHAYWVNLDPSLFNTMLNVSVIHPDPGYYFYFDDFTLSLLWDMDATSLDPLLARNVNIEYNTEFQGTFPLYFSSLPLSDDIVQGDQFTSAVTVPVHYVTEDGAELDFQTVELYPNESMTVRPSSYATEGYTLVSSDRVDVYVDGSGYANPAEVFFVYRFDEPEPTQAPDTPVDVIYQLEDGTVLDQQTLYYQPGAYSVTPNSGAVADLELASSGSVDVFVDAGFASPNPVIFTYRMPYVAPAETNILVYYYHENGSLLDMQEVRVVEGPNTITPNSAAVSGYELTSESSVNVTVYPDGSTDVASVTFLYKDVYVAPAETNILVYYYHENGSLLDMQEVRVVEGPNTITPNSAAVSGYELTSESSVNVTVYPDGSTDVPSVTFLYKDVYVAPAETNILVYYYHENGDLLDMQEVRVVEGPNTITPNSAAVSGYELTSESSVNVTVYPDGSTDVPSVTFLYKDVYVAPAETNILVYYYHENGSLLDMQEVRVVEGPNTITPNSTAVSGYELTSEASVNVTVYPDGSTDVASATFLYKDVYVAPAETNILVYYYHENGSLLDMQEVRVVEGPNTITPNSAAVSGYELTSESSVIVTVYPDGSTDVPSVTFLYKDVYVAPTEATISILYQSEDYRDVAPAQTKVLPNGTHVITPAPEGLSPDYELIPGLHEQVEVVVENGVASPDVVVFYYQLKKAVPTQTLEPIEPIEPEPVKVNVTIHYYNTMGEEIASSQTVTLTPGEHELTAAPSDLPEGYELAMDATMTVTVFDDGTFSPPAEEVAFYYRPVQSKPALAEITVRYLDDRGADIASEQKIRLPDGTHPVTANPLDLPQGYVIVPGTESTVEVIVRNGVANKSTIVFYYMQHQPETFDVTVYYFDTMGKEIASSQTVSLTPGEYQFTADPAVAAAGYELMSDEVLLVKVHEDGTIKPEEVSFYYRVAQKKAAVPVTYVDTNGRIIAGPFTVELSGNQNHTIRADASRVPAAFDPDSAAPVSVYVNADGVANPPQVTLVFAAKVQETPIPVGEKIFRYGTITGNDVAFRTEASTSGGKKTIITRLDKNEKVFMLEEMYNKKGESWAHIMVDGQEGYMMSEFLSVMTQAESDRYAASLGATPVPTYTPLPTMTPPPTATPTILPTEEPTEEFVQMITPAIQTPAPTLPELPAGTPTPVPYSGYALTTRVTALRTGISSSDISIINSMEANVLLNVTTQTYDPITGEPWSIVTTLNGQSGFVQHASLRPITAEEAYPYILLWQQQNATPAPTILATNTPEPEQVQGYGVTIGDNVPLRAMHSEYSRIVDYLSRDTVVYISGQVYVDGVAWHSVQYQGNWGYIRSDLVRLMTLMEEDAYLDSLFATPEPTLVTTNQPYDETRPSSYGYVNTSSLNIREEASMDSRRIGALKRYALCLVLGSEYVNGKQWYWISYNDQVGYVHGDYFRELSVAEFRDFMESDEYRQGILNNSTSSSGGSDDIGHGGASGIVSAEDQTVNQWNDPNSGIYVSYAPFNPIATIPPIGATENPYPTLEPLPGFETQAPTNTFLPFTTATYVPPQSVDGEGDESSGGFGWVVVPIVIGVILLIGGGVFAIVWQQQKRRKIAMRAAQRRAQAARSAERPYARQAGQQPRTGTYPNQNQQYTGSYTASQQVRRPSQIKPMNDDLPTYQRTSQETAPYKPYGKTDVQQSADPFGMDLPTENAPAARSGRVGRRTAYRQAQAAKDAETGLNQKDDPFHLEDSE